MGRPLRIEYPGAFYHVTARGNERKIIFQSDKDYTRFTGYFESATEKYGARIHCFCLMSNHYHLLLETPRGNLHSILHHVNTGYTNYFNSRRRRAGHLFQGRYHAILVDKDSYGLELSRYIHLNPWRSRLGSDPFGYRWSSCSSYVGKGKRWDWLETAFILSQVGRGERQSRQRYEQFLREGMAKGLKDPFRKVVASTVLGSERFVGWVRKKWVGKEASDREIPALKKLSVWPHLSLIQQKCERAFGIGSGESRRIGMYLSHRLSGVPLAEIGKYFGGVGPSAVTQNSRRIEKKFAEDRELLVQAEMLKRTLSE